jgi:6-phosphofructokinase 1
MAGLAGGAEAIVIPEREVDPETIADLLRAASSRGKKCAVIVVAEGARNNAERLTQYFHSTKSNPGFELRATILGHVQRGGIRLSTDCWRPVSELRQMESLVNGTHGVLTGWIDGRVQWTPSSEVVSKVKQLDLRLLDMAGMLSINRRMRAGATLSPPGSA